MKIFTLILQAFIASLLFYSCNQAESPGKKLERLDNRHFALMKQGEFDKSLKVALEYCRQPAGVIILSGLC